MNKEDIEELKRENKALKQANIEYKDIIDKALKQTHEILGFLENCDSGNQHKIQNCIKIFNKYLEILRGDLNV